MKKKKNPLAETLINTLLDDVQKIEDESSYNMHVQTSHDLNKIVTEIEKESHDSIELPVMQYEEDPILTTSDDDKTIALPSVQSPQASAIQSENVQKTKVVDSDKTIAVTSIQVQRQKKQAASQQTMQQSSHFSDQQRDQQARIVGHVHMPSNSAEAALMQSENLKIAQQRILELENEVDKLRSENEELASAGDTLRRKTDDLYTQLSHIEVDKKEREEVLQSEINILKSSLQFKDKEIQKSQSQVEELEIRLKSDLKKIRVRERDLENRLELAKIEKTALVRSKDETILELKRKIDHLEGELDSYRDKCLDLNKKIEMNQDQFRRTVKALRLALTNLEVSDDIANLLKKAE